MQTNVIKYVPQPFQKVANTTNVNGARSTCHSMRPRTTMPYADKEFDPHLG